MDLVSLKARGLTADDEAMRRQLLVPFDNEEPAFARGAEVGVLLVRLATEPRPVNATVHADNAEMLLRLAEAAGSTVRAEDLGGDWLDVTFQ